MQASSDGDPHNRCWLLPSDSHSFAGISAGQAGRAAPRAVGVEGRNRSRAAPALDQHQHSPGRCDCDRDGQVQVQVQEVAAQLISGQPKA
jgi:hypothetical protein